MNLQVDSGLRIPARDGFRLAATLYEPDPGDDRNAAVLINSATAVPRGSPAISRARASRC